MIQYSHTNPTLTVLEVVSKPEQVQTVHDATIASTAGAARNLGDISVASAHSASTHQAAQVRHETLATKNAAGAEDAVTDTVYFASEGRAGRHESAASSEHVLANSASTRAAESAAKAGHLEQVAKIQVAVTEVSRRIETGLKEVEDRTNAGVMQDMKVAQAVSDKSTTQEAAALDQEKKLAALAEAPTLK